MLTAQPLKHQFTDTPVNNGYAQKTSGLIEPPAAFADIVGPYDDFRGELHDKGFVVIKNAIPRERAIQYQEKAYEWLQSFPGDLDFSNPETWIAKNLPLQNGIKVYIHYGVAHEKFVWDAKQEPGVLDAFAKLWQTDELLVSFDGINITFPNRKDIPRRAAWEHIDQSPLRRGAHCIQGIINLSPSGPNDGGLVLYPKSHNYNAEFFDSRDDKSSWLPMKDLHLFTKEELAWFRAKGLQPHKPGHTLRRRATEKSNQIRTAIYATYTPANLAEPTQLAIKNEVFEKFGSTTHWPHQYIVSRPTQAMLPDGTRDPRDRDQPREMPEMTDKLLKLAGAKRY
ncbi:uncharacterized protein AB675_7370 [Cyphellophora attinorum]|uniref:Phytanoyl-CoA dioxygenase n=1 Tax=Cyphellophora attinorum TaxID=1664694 RepID=A0A0N0NIZ0_9EURO|nr:uncharacterized protein AB675_7370 [Phialophora attinorum]KPI36308.1 hypothetical protein AB675_7370 [Phialophora attinorum]